jgi:hypothetical protein
MTKTRLRFLNSVVLFFLLDFVVYCVFFSTLLSHNYILSNIRLRQMSYMVDMEGYATFFDIVLSFAVSIIVRETTLPWGTLTPDPENSSDWR